MVTSGIHEYAESDLSALGNWHIRHSWEVLQNTDAQASSNLGIIDLEKEDLSASFYEKYKYWLCSAQSTDS